MALLVKPVMVVIRSTGTAAVLALQSEVSVAKTLSQHHSQAYSAVSAEQQMDYPVGLLSATLVACPLAVPYQRWDPHPSFRLPPLLPLLHLSRTPHSFDRVMAMAHHNLGKELRCRVSLYCRNYRASLFIHLYVYYVVPCYHVGFLSYLSYLSTAVTVAPTHPPGQILPRHIGQNGYVHYI